MDRNSPEASVDRVRQVTGVTPERAFDGAAVRRAVRDLLVAIGEDPDREGLADTPDRVARAYDEMFAGLLVDPRDVLSVTFEERHDEVVVVRDVAFGRHVAGDGGAAEPEREARGHPLAQDVVDPRASAG